MAADQNRSFERHGIAVQHAGHQKHEAALHRGAAPVLRKTFHQVSVIESTNFAPVGAVAEAFSPAESLRLRAFDDQQALTRIASRSA
ncbi:hypothetical protein [Sphingomonas carotinifaciens]|uniref:Uncharacterized protein n=1 Tax=Sphingomonas carotinifaciens TaxID=1166323 RepID=A0A6N8M131_9SPHN|nr:hypothetical protein [Sphingomonas carotinifaciens]MBB4088008.1 hypothetical protein [Sphingomonas carotinifaciens]MWC45548.1 hypothetical protein [Sphingomonas carotinifaciens]